jgi:hypothetical protein
LYIISYSKWGAEEMRRAVAAVFLTLLLLLTGCSGLIHSSSRTVSVSPQGVNSAASNSISGLSLSLSLDSATYQPGQTVNIAVDEFNTLTKTNNVAAAGNWASPGLSVGPCGTLNYPFGIAIFQGYHTAGDLAYAAPLKLDNPNAVYNCPMILAEISTYAFQPSGDSADVFQLGGIEPVLTEQMNAQIHLTGYWTGSPNGILNGFAPGVYTVVAGDEWGALVVLHFTVSQ